jgi:hypothetical protein
LGPLHFGDTVGIVTGIIGAADGFGGFLLPLLLGVMKDNTGGYGAGFLTLSAVAFLAALALMLLSPVWLRNWDRSASARTGIFALTITTAAHPQPPRSDVDGNSCQRRVEPARGCRADSMPCWA